MYIYNKKWIKIDNCQKLDSGQKGERNWTNCSFYGTKLTTL